MLLHDRPESASALAADAAQRLQAAWRCKAFSVLEEWAFDTSDFEVGVHVVCDTAEFGVGTVLLTVSARRERASRTYVCNSPRSGWPGEFEKDLHAGLFGSCRSVGSDASRLPDKPATHRLKRTVAAHGVPAR
jgi:hypothetical protein